MWTFSDMRTSVEHQLLSMHFYDKVSADHDNDLHLGAIAEVIRLSAMIYVNLVLRCILPLSSIHIRLSSQMNDKIDRIEASIKHYQHERLKILLWSVMLGGAVSTDAMVRNRLNSVAVNLYHRLQIHSWIECYNNMEGLVFSDRGCGDLCEKFNKEVIENKDLMVNNLESGQTE
jgi:hypothetical protein